MQLQIAAATWRTETRDVALISSSSSRVAALMMMVNEGI